MKCISIVVLNYINYSDTIDCVESIINQKNKNFKVVIVENGSPNDSFFILMEKFGQHPLITIIRNKNNLGFAKGNNVGINYSNNVLGIDYIFVLNSDTILNENLIDDIFKLSVEDDVAVFSPTVTDEFGVVQIPTINVNDIKSFTFKAILSLFLALFLNSPGMNRLYKQYKKNNHANEDSTGMHNNFTPFKYSLHGSAFFLTPLFFKYYKNPFPGTFLYWEEINLIWYLHKVNLRAAVYETSGVFHKESMSISQIAAPSKVSMWKLKKSFSSLLRSLPLYFCNYNYVVKTYNSK
ncbi:glycosyltransferase family 2 protein [Flavobacterium sp. F-328]|uniref:Glycosyltransferase family 2 protein n=1 Tax=Flavobacterium erciyesense TaxID=2825842 RepID=A0ABS5D6K9_9FLAO|nr:glycosyltransferase [Flavobacterium erciyesense]MBQ0909633.1 glycosyltransferase family 2 protein [Flavobacterium erciyesense]